MTTQSQPSTPTRLPLLRAWWVADRGGVIRVVGLVIASISFLLLWPSLIEVGGAPLLLRNMAVHLYVLAWMMLATIGVRSIGTREVITAYFLGTFLVPVLVFGPLTPFIKWLGTDSETLGVLFVPPVEEGAILIGVALVAWRLCRRTGRRPGVLDMVVVGWSIGSGLAIHEDALYGRFMANFYDGALAGAFEGPYGILFPTFPVGILEGGVGAGVYHSGKGALFGLAVGLVIVLRHRMAWIIAVIPALWLFSTFDHALYNYQVWNELNPLRFLTGNGHFSSILLLLTVPTMLVFEPLRRRQGDLGLPAFGLRGIREAFQRGSGLLDTVVRLLAYGHYHRGRNAAMTAAWSQPGAPTPSISGVEAWGRLAFATKQRIEPASSGAAD